jgi:hypothetical protein
MNASEARKQTAAARSRIKSVKAKTTRKKTKDIEARVREARKSARTFGYHRALNTVRNQVGEGLSSATFACMEMTSLIYSSDNGQGTVIRAHADTIARKLRKDGYKVDVVYNSVTTRYDNDGASIESKEWYNLKISW